MAKNSARKPPGPPALASLPSLQDFADLEHQLARVAKQLPAGTIVHKTDVYYDRPAVAASAPLTSLGLRPYAHV